MLWTYADRHDDGCYERVGGGAYDAGDRHLGPGRLQRRRRRARRRGLPARLAADRRRRTAASAAYQMLRGLTYLQTATGPNARQRGALDAARRHAEPAAPSPVELPDPSDSDASYWLARTVWALGEGYAAFRDADPAFARFLEQRLDLARRRRSTGRCSTRYGELPARRRRAARRRWLIVDGADASAEAVLGLAAYVARRRHPARPTRAAPAQRGHRRRCPAATPAPGRSAACCPGRCPARDWHAWASQMPAALAERRRRPRRPAAWPAPPRRDSFTFDPWLLTSGGPDNGRLPTRADATQIAYGADSRVQSPRSRPARRAGDRLAGV